jgi:FMN phosphatase YigB (HAD superfamily)
MVKKERLYMFDFNGLKPDEIKMVAFDLGGVLAYRDLSVLSAEEQNLLLIYQKYMGIKDVNPKDKEFLEYAGSKMEEITRKIYKLNSETLDVLKMLYYNGIDISLWTNNTPYLNSSLEQVGILRYIPLENVINSYYLGYDKPNKYFYLKALELLLIRASQILFVDDNRDNLISAKNCGIQTLEYDMSMSLKDSLSFAFERIRKRKMKDLI